MTSDFLNIPRSLKNLPAVDERKAMLFDPHIAPLTNYVLELRRRHGEKWEFPFFDPADGGVDAQILFLFEKPGPMTSAIGHKNGSGFISRNNDDATAAHTFQLMERAKIPRKLSVTWNVIPGWNGTIPPRAEELRRGIEELNNLFPLLLKLKCVVLVGRKAEKANQFFFDRNIPIISSSHPSMRVRNFYPEKWNSISEQWAGATRYVSRQN